MLAEHRSRTALPVSQQDLHHWIVHLLIRRLGQEQVVEVLLVRSCVDYTVAHRHPVHVAVPTKQGSDFRHASVNLLLVFDRHSDHLLDFLLVLRPLIVV